MRLQVQINDADYKRVIKAIKPLETSEESVLKRAVNDTAKKAQATLISKASARYTGKAAGERSLKRQSTIDKASVSGVASVLRFASPMQEIGQFHVSSMAVSRPAYTKGGKRRKKNLKGNVLRGSSKLLGGAFVVRFESKHVAVVKRSEHENMKKYRAKPRLPHYAKLEKLLSPNVPEMAGNKEVYKPDEIADLLHEEINQVLKKVLGG